MVGSTIAGRIRVLDIYHHQAAYPRLNIRLGITLQELPKSESSSGRPLKEYEIRDLRVSFVSKKVARHRGNPRVK